MGAKPHSTIFVLFWEYTDKSSSGVYRAYQNKDRGEADIQCLEDQAVGSSRNFQLLEIPLYGDYD